MQTVAARASDQVQYSPDVLIRDYAAVRLTSLSLKWSGSCIGHQLTQCLGRPEYGFFYILWEGHGDEILFRVQIVLTRLIYNA